MKNASRKSIKTKFMGSIFSIFSPAGTHTIHKIRVFNNSCPWVPLFHETPIGKYVDALFDLITLTARMGIQIGADIIVPKGGTISSARDKIHSAASSRACRAALEPILYVSV